MKTKWTLEKIKEESKRIHGDIFYIYSVDILEYGTQGHKTPYVNLECVSCGYRNLMAVKSHIHKKIGCKQCSKNMWSLDKVRKKSKEIHNEKFKGWTECFNMEILNEFA